ncbi:MAG: putative basic amino acid antiporter YfcC [Pseudomonadota bacterium]|nr:putative basic amino acid antiporter YfcC [Pseudomonadota bacterium]MDQ3159633.1 putative basic amino acid antiporter YfcC [Pseudomonadota bacterium]
MSHQASESRQPREGPNTLVILFVLVTVLALATPFLPRGYFAEGMPVSLASFRAADAPAHMQLFATGDDVGFLNFLFHGLTSGTSTSAAIGVIALLFLVGGAFAVVNATGAVDRGLVRLIKLTGGRPALLLGCLFVVFSLGGAVFGMGEETIAFLALLLPLTSRLGLPRECAVMCTYMASQIGFATSWMNPFSVAVAQGIAEVPLLSGAPFRIVLWSTFTVVGAIFTIRYASARRQPVESTVDVASNLAVDAATANALNWADRTILLAILATVGWIVWGVTARGHYLPEIATQFFALGLFCGLVAWADGRMRPNRIAELFSEGAQQLVPVALVIASAQGMLWLLGGTGLHDPSVLNAALFALASGMDQWPPLLAAEGMFALQSAFNFFVTSGSAQAAITMPLMAGLSDLVGVTRQVAVLAFQLGDGLTNLVVPTSAVLMGVIGVARLNWSEWIRIIWRFALLLMAMGAGFVALGVLSGLS